MEEAKVKYLQQQFPLIKYEMMILLINSDLKALTNVVIPDSNVNAPGDLTPLKNLRELVLSSSLIWNWRTVADIIKQIPHLTVLDLS